MDDALNKSLDKLSREFDKIQLDNLGQASKIGIVKEGGI